MLIYTNKRYVQDTLLHCLYVGCLIVAKLEKKSNVLEHSSIYRVVFSKVFSVPIYGHVIVIVRHAKDFPSFRKQKLVKSANYEDKQIFRLLRKNKLRTRIKSQFQRGINEGLHNKFGMIVC